MNKAVFSLHNISKTFKQGAALLTVLKNITVQFNQRHTYAITGASGSGKSTLLHIIAGLEKPTEGNVVYNTTDITRIGVKQKEQFFNKEIGLIFQLPYLIDELTVLENVASKGIIGGMSANECNGQAMKLLEHLGIADKAKSLPRVLSGGQQQRVSIARALITKPTFLLADEPTGNLDEKTGLGVINLLLQYQKEHGMGLIISSHDNYVVQKMEKIVMLKDGYLHDVTEG